MSNNDIKTMNEMHDADVASYNIERTPELLKAVAEDETMFQAAKAAGTLRKFWKE